jgi:flagellar motor switch protein FliM
MSEESLRPSEIESLLSAMDTSRGTVADTSRGHSGRRTAGTLRGEVKITPYDFKRPERVGKEQMRTLQSLHEGFARGFGAALSGLLRSIVDVKLTSVDQLTYSEFVFSLENPTCFSLIRAEPLENSLILDINPSILFPIIDRLLGGGRDSGPLARRPLTEIELRLVGRITKIFLDELHRAWEHVLELQLNVVKVESNPQLVQVVPPNEVVVLISFELTLGDSRGMINLCIPFNSIERIGGKLASNSWLAYGKKPTTPESVRQVSRQVGGALVEVVAELVTTRITTGDLIGLRVGDIIATTQDVHRPIRIAVQGSHKFEAFPGAFRGRKAVRIEEIVGPTPG